MLLLVCGPIPALGSSFLHIRASYQSRVQLEPIRQNPGVNKGFSIVSVSCPILCLSGHAPDSEEERREGWEVGGKSGGVSERPFRLGSTYAVVGFVTVFHESRPAFSFSRRCFIRVWNTSVSIKIHQSFERGNSDLRGRLLSNRIPQCPIHPHSRNDTVSRPLIPFWATTLAPTPPHFISSSGKTWGTG